MIKFSSYRPSFAPEDKKVMEVDGISLLQVAHIGKQIWDEIPSEINSSESFNIFKKSYKKLLLETTVETE